MFPASPQAIDVPLPIRTPRLLLRLKQPGDGFATSVAVQETWDELHQWMEWAEDRETHTPELAEARITVVLSGFLRRELIELQAIEVATGQPVVWCGFYNLDWEARTCFIGYWARRSVHGRGLTTEAANAHVRYAFGALGMRRVCLTLSAGNEASRRIVEKLGFTYEGTDPQANTLPGGRKADRLNYFRDSTEALPPLDVQWGAAAGAMRMSS